MITRVEHITGNKKSEPFHVSKGLSIEEERLFKHGQHQLYAFCFASSLPKFKELVLSITLQNTWALQNM